MSIESPRYGLNAGPRAPERTKRVQPARPAATVFGGKGPGRQRGEKSLLVEIRKDRNHWVGSFGPVLVLFWLHEIQPEACQRVGSIARELAAQQPSRRIAVVSVSLPDTQPPGAEARSALAQLVAGAKSSVARVAIVREGQGFVASAVSSIVTGIRLLAKPQSPHAFFGDLEQAVRWAAEGLNGTAEQLDVDKLLGAVEHRSRSLKSWPHDSALRSQA